MQNLFYLNLQDLRPDIDVYEAFATAESCFVILDWKDWTERTGLKGLDWNFNRRMHA